MVLEAAFDDAPTSDFDPYDATPPSSSQTPNGKPSALHIDLSQASRPFPIIGPLAGFNQAHLVALVSNIAKSAPHVLHRPMTQPEVDATVASISKYMQVHSWIYCNALIAGSFRARATSAEMVWPGQKFLMNRNVKFDLNYEVFGPLRGQAARIGWNVVRSSSWVAWWGVPAYIVGGVVGQIFMAQKQLADPRLKDFHDIMRGGDAKKRVADAVARRRDGLPPQTASGGDDDMSPQMETPTAMDRTEDVRQRGQDQFMRSSPKEPAPQTSTGAPQTPGGRYGYASEPQPQPSSQPQSQSQSQSRPQPSPRPDSSPFNPTPEQASGTTAWDRVRGSTGQSESAWDRVRRAGGGAAGSANEGSGSSWQTQARRDGGGNNSVPRTDSFSFDQRDEDRQLARAEAQREFNERLEKERQGQDFSDTKGGRMW